MRGERQGGSMLRVWRSGFRGLGFAGTSRWVVLQ